ncbi:hypothetical protein SEA_PATELGO_107 [Streptomyces phage Patelgo]|nr:hypothetical protein SEA_PATELGO_107 [Streptomyces phage Patelgo]
MKVKTKIEIHLVNGDVLICKKFGIAEDSNGLMFEAVLEDDSTAFISIKAFVWMKPIFSE